MASILETFKLLLRLHPVPWCRSALDGVGLLCFSGTMRSWCSSEEFSHQLETVNYPLQYHNIPCVL
jgi:hypothetical protein